MKRLWLLFVIFSWNALAQPAPRWQVDLARFGYEVPTNRAGDLRATFFQFGEQTALVFAGDRLISCYELPKGLVTRKRTNPGDIPRVRCIFFDPQTGAYLMQREFEIGGEPFIWSAGQNFLLHGPAKLTLYSAEGEVRWSWPFAGGRVEVSPSGATLLVAAGMPPRAGGSVQDVTAFRLPDLEERGALRVPGAVHICALDDSIVYSIARGSGIYSIQAWPIGGEARVIQQGSGHWQRIGAVSSTAFVTDLKTGDKPELALFSAATGAELAHRSLRRAVRLDYFSSASGTVFAVSRVDATFDFQKAHEQTITVFDLQLQPRFELSIKRLPAAMAVAALSADGRSLAVLEGSLLRGFDVPSAGK